MADRDRADASAAAGRTAAGGTDAGPPAFQPGRRRQAGRGQAGGGRGSDRFEGGGRCLRGRRSRQGRRLKNRSASVLPPGYRIEPVLTEPDIEEPMQIAFDGNGRMFVVEIRG